MRSADWRVREIGSAKLFVDVAGRFAFSKDSQLPPAAGPENSSLRELAGVYLSERRRAFPKTLDYLILVPTLRCNLACSYCQVSRASETARGYDWDDETLSKVLSLIAGLEAPTVKIEFQGGEPTLRPDLIKAVIDAVPDRVNATFVICSNLQLIDNQVLRLLERPDVTISTSLDGPIELHGMQRGNLQIAKAFRQNLESVIERYGSGKVSALPTINPEAPPDPASLIAAFDDFGFESIFLRPINYQGFARKNHSTSREIGEAWTEYHRKFIEFLIELNWHERDKLREETYFSLLLRRIFRPGSDRHVDLRNPNPLGHDYIVIDHDGTIFPTDEARMLSRSGIIDLSIGDLDSGWASQRRDDLNAHSSTDGDPDCEACVYQAYCGRDLIDDIARYGTVAKRRTETEFCRRHMSLFDFAFRLISSRDEKVRYSLGRWLGLGGALPLMEHER